jgi:cobalt/nickel transport system ATP-binding protein
VSHHLVEARSLSFQWEDVPVLRDLSFVITHGESVAVIGANGAGKSTLLLQMTGCLLPTRGEMRVGDLPVTRKTLAAVRRAVGMVFQEADDQLFMPTVFEDVSFGPRNLGLTEEEVRVRVDAALATVGAGHLHDRPPYKLSGGEKRAVSIATVLAMHPDILVLDEPSANLDPRSRRQLIELLKAFEHTRIIATHDLDLVRQVCARTLLLKDGALLADGATVDLLADEALLDEAGLV